MTNALWNTTYMPGFQDLKPTGDVWLRFETSEDEEAEAEANTYHYENGFTVGWYLNSVGLVTYVGTFPTEDAASAWLESQGFEDFTS